MKKNINKELKAKILSKINSFISGSTPPMTLKTLEEYLRAKIMSTDYSLDIKDGSRDIIVISGGQQKPVPLSSLTKSELFGTTMTDRFIQTFGEDLDALAAAVAQHYTETHAFKRKAGQQRQKRMRERRRTDIRAGNPRRLDFLWEAFRMKGISTDHEMARRVGCSPQNIYHLKLNDNLKVSALEQMLASVGLKVEINLKNTGNLPVWSRNRQVRFHIGSNNAPHYYDYLKQALVGRLSCLAREVIGSGVNLKAFCSRANLPYYKIRNALVNDDIMLSELEHVAEAMDRILILDIWEM